MGGEDEDGVYILGSGTQPGPQALSYVSYYAGAVLWAWNTAWIVSADKLAWGIPVALASAAIGALIARHLGGNWRPALIGSLVGAVVGPLLVLSALFVINLMRYPVVREAELSIRPHTLGSNATFTIFDALRGEKDLQVPGGWNVIITGPGDSGPIQSDIRVILREALTEVHFLELPDYNLYADAPRFPEPSGSAITIHGSNSLAQALKAIGGCFSIKITNKTADGLEQFYRVKNLVWIEFGKGSPWQTDMVCSG